MDKRVLGKGLEALIPRKAGAPAVSAATREFTYLSLDKLRPGKYQPRQDFGEKELAELAQSIKEKGFIQPLVVRKTSEDAYEVIAGERRYQAAVSLKLAQVPVIIKNIDDRESLTIAIIENLQRKDLNPIEEAQAFKRLMEEFEFTLDAVAKFVSKDKTTVSNTLRLLKLPDEIKKALRKGVISRSQARTLLGLPDEEDQKKLFEQILSGRFAVREIEKKVKSASRKKKNNDPHVLEVEEKLQKVLGTRVKIFHKKNNRGKIVIEYFNLLDFERILSRIKT